MNIRLNILKDANNAGLTHFGGVPLDEVLVRITQDGIVAYSGYLSVASDPASPESISLNDNHGFELIGQFSRDDNYNAVTDIGTIILDLPIRRITDSVTFELQVSNLDYFTYSNVITVYGYDLGVSMNFDDTGDGKFTGIPNGDAIAIANNVFNPCYGVETLTDNTTYGEEDGVVVVRHNPNFNIGMIPVEILDSVLGTPKPNDFSYGCSNRIIAIPNPNDNTVRVVDGNSNAPTLPSRNASIAYKLVGDVSYTDTGLLETTISVPADTHVAKFFSLGTEPLEIQTRVVSRVTQLLPTYIREINGTAFSSFTGVLSGDVELAVDIDDVSVFKYWACGEFGITPIASVILKYDFFSKDDIADSYVLRESVTKKHNYHTTDVLTSSTAYDAYSKAAMSESNPMDYNYVKVEVGVYFVTKELDANIKSGVDLLAAGNTYMIVSRGVDSADSFTGIGAANNDLYTVFTANTSAGAFTFSSNGALALLDVDTAVSLGLFVQAEVANVYNNIEDVILTDTLTYSSLILGYAEHTSLYESVDSLEFANNALYSIMASECNTLTWTVYRADTAAEHVLNVEVWDTDTSAFIATTGYPITVESSGLEDIVTTISVEDGIYRITIDGEYYTYIAMCGIIQCYVDIIKGTVCGCCTTDDCKAKAYYRFNEFMVLWNVYLSMISVSVEDFDYVDTGLINYSDLLDYVEIDKLMARLSDVCDNCSGITKKCTNC